MSGSLLYGLYRTATILAEPAMRPWLASRLRAGKEDGARLGERRGIPSRPRPPGALVWLHGASVGEGVALLPLIGALSARGLHVLVTTGTVNAARVMAGRLPAGVTHQFVPLDVPRYWRRFLGFWRPALAMLAEAELWPNLIHDLRRREIPLVLVNARMSARSAQGWRRAESLIRAMLSRTALCLAQTEEDLDRLQGFGAARALVTGQMKFDVAPPPASPDAVAALSAQIGGRPAWVAASTHAEEEAALLDIHAAVARAHPGLLTIVVPRQPVRGTALAEACAARRLPAALRSRGEPLTASVGLYIADTIGELGLSYRVTGLAFLGKSLGGGGGQNPIEAAKLGNAVLHGPLVGNFADVYAGLDAAGGALAVDGPEALSRALGDLLSDPARLRRMSRAALDWAERQGGATGRTMLAIEPLLVQALSRTVP